MTITFESESTSGLLGSIKLLLLFACGACATERFPSMRHTHPTDSAKRAALSEQSRPIGPFLPNNYSPTTCPEISGRGSLSGLVVDQVSGFPQSLVIVTINGPVHKTLTTNSEGTFFFCGVPDGSYHVTLAYYDLVEIRSLDVRMNHTSFVKVMMNTLMHSIIVDGYSNDPDSSHR